MSWRYLQSSGWLYEPSGHLLARGYSGRDEGKNNPAFAMIRNVGPIPVGEYTIGTAVDSPKLGPVVMPLMPSASNAMFKRAGFFVHGDAIAHPGKASDGCIILPRHVREAMAASADRLLVVEGDRAQELKV